MTLQTPHLCWGQRDWVDDIRGAFLCGGLLMPPARGEGRRAWGVLASYLKPSSLEARCLGADDIVVT